MNNKLKLSSYFIKLSIVLLLLFFLFGCGGPIPSGPTINSFTATPNVIDPGGSSTLSWTVNNATSVTIDQGIGSVAVSSGTSSVTPGATTTYTLTATNSAGSVTATTKVRVNETKIIQPGSEGKDARVDEYFNDKNYGGQEFLYIGKTVVVFPGLMRAYLQFDLSAIPANAEVIEAKLKLYQYDYFVSGSFSIGVYRVLDNWAESTITWDNQPDSDLTNFGSITISSSTVGKWREWNIRNWVQGWLDGSFENNGILLKATSETTIEARGYFYSSDYTDDTTKRPKLEIKYYIP